MVMLKKEPLLGNEYKLIMNLQEFIEQYLIVCKVEKGLSVNSVSSYKRDLKYFYDFLSTIIKGDINPEAVTKNHIRKYLEDLYLKELKRSSFLRKISSINQFFSYLLAEKIVSYNPLVEVKRPQKEARLPKFLSPDEVNQLIAAAAKPGNKFSIRMVCIIAMLFSSGLRISELLDIKVQDVCVNNEPLLMIKVKGKGNKERLVPINSLSQQALAKYLTIREQFVTYGEKNDYLFVSRGKLQRLTREQVGMLLKKVAMTAGIDPHKVSPHVLRHSFATNLCNKKVNLRVIQELLGHSDISTTEIYLNTADQEIIDFVRENHPLGDNKVEQVA